MKEEGAGKSRMEGEERRGEKEERERERERGRRKGEREKEGRRVREREGGGKESQREREREREGGKERGGWSFLKGCACRAVVKGPVQERAAAVAAGYWCIAANSQRWREGWREREGEEGSE